MNRGITYAFNRQYYYLHQILFRQIYFKSTEMSVPTINYNMLLTIKLSFTAHTKLY